MKTLKISSLILAVGFVVLFAYANLRRLSVVDRLEPVHLVSFDIQGTMSPNNKMQVEKKISSIEGVTACSLSQEGNVASIIFHPEKINAATISSLLSKESKLNLTLRDLSASPGCPIHNVSSSFQKLISTLDIRN